MGLPAEIASTCHLQLAEWITILMSLLVTCIKWNAITAVTLTSSFQKESKIDNIQWFPLTFFF